MALSDERPPTPLWTLVPAVAAPVLLGLTWAWMAAFDPMFRTDRDTISDMGAHGAPHGWVISASLAAVGACNVASAVGLRSVPLSGRFLLALGGVAGASVGYFRNPTPWVVDGTPHAQLSGIAFVSLAVWPLFAWRPHVDGIPRVLRLGPLLAGSAVLLGLLVAFVVLLGRPTHQEGRMERIVVVADTTWTLVVVLGLQRHRVQPAVRHVLGRTLLTHART